MALAANFPVGMAPGMGLNAFFAFTVVGAAGLPWQQALGRCSSPAWCSWCCR
jgi:AGZA family xanthine/uracil permease-like MFS transporter